MKLPARKPETGTGFTGCRNMTGSQRPTVDKKNSGFTLVEIAMVLMIIGLLLGGLIPTLSTQMEAQRIAETRKQLDEIQQALVGYAIANDRLPCPASSGSNGAESFAALGNATNGNCSNFYNGFVPAATLGVTSVVDSQGNTGFAVDAWGNRIRYAVTSANSNAFTKENGMRTVGISSLSPNLQVCSTASTSSTSCSVSNSSLTSGVPAVIYSTGKNGAYGGAGLDEAENPNPNSTDNDRVFAFHVPSPSTATNGEFDDLVVWVSPNILFNRMVMAGRLP